MSLVSIHISEPTPGRIQCDLDSIMEGLPNEALIGGPEFMALTMPQRFGLVLNEMLKQTDLGQMIINRCLTPASARVDDDDEGPTRRQIQYPCRCKITDPEGEVVFETETHEAVALQNPSVAVPKLGRTGTAYKEGSTVRIELDDGSTIMGYECWWEPIADTN